MCTYIDRKRIEIAIRFISLNFLGLYQCFITFLTHTLGNSAPNFNKFSIIFFLSDFERLYLLPQLHHQNTFQRLIKNLPLIYKQCREENMIKKYQQYFKNL